MPDKAIGTKGRTVRCGKCHHEWHQNPTPEMLAAAEELPDLNLLIDEINARPKVKPVPKGSNLPAIPFDPLTLGQKLTLGTFAIAATALFLLWVAPGLYGQPSSKGLVLADVGTLRMADKDKRVSYEINGKIANTTDKSMHVPTLRVTLVDADGASLQYWDFTGDPAAIEPHKDIPFATGELDVRFSKGVKFVAEIGSPLELALRRKP